LSPPATQRGKIKYCRRRKIIYLRNKFPTAAQEKKFAAQEKKFAAQKISNDCAEK
jgi:hypothetical protein